jgi:hypothetical protein
VWTFIYNDTPMPVQFSEPRMWLTDGAGHNYFPVRERQTSYQAQVQSGQVYYVWPIFRVPPGVTAGELRLGLQLLDARTYAVRCSERQTSQCGFNQLPGALQQRLTSFFSGYTGFKWWGGRL